MKVYACYIVLNEADYLDLSIKSIYNAVDGIIIVEGAEKIIRNQATKEGLSIDNTTNIIKGYPDYLHKIKYIQKGWVDWQGDLRNEYLKYLPKDTDWFLMIDGDELYKEAELNYALRIVQDMNFKFDVIAFNHVQFYRDIYHIKHHLQDTLFYRLYKYYPDMYYKRPCDTNLMMPKKEVLRFCYTNTFHFGWARSKKRLLNKIVWTLKYGMQRSNNHLELEKYTNKQLEEYALKNHEIFKNLQAQRRVFKYGGDYPTVEIIRRWEKIK